MCAAADPRFIVVAAAGRPAENPPRPEGKKKTPNPVYTTGDHANTRAAVLTILAVLWLTLCLGILPEG